MLDQPKLTLEIDPQNQRLFGPCECCGQMTSRVWGYVYRSDEALAAYYVEWTPGHDSKQANFDLILGKWGEDTTPEDRQAVALEFRQLETGPAFRVIDAKDRKIGSSSLVSVALDRSAVVDTPISAVAFAICGAIFLDDPRIDELRT